MSKFYIFGEKNFIFVQKYLNTCLLFKIADYSIFSNGLLSNIREIYQKNSMCNRIENSSKLKLCSKRNLFFCFPQAVRHLANFVFNKSLRLNVKIRYSLKELGLLFSVSILQIRPSIFKEIFWRFLAHFLNFVKKNQNSLKGFFLTFLAYFSMSKKTQDVFGCFLLIFSRFFNSIKKNQDI